MSNFDIGIDLGTTKIMAYIESKGIVLNEPSVVALNTKRNEVIAIGYHAYEMIGKTPAYIQAMRPLKDGVISDHNMAELIITDVIKKVSDSFMIKPRVAICIPSATTDVEMRAITSAAVNAGARRVYLIQEPIAAAIGCGVDISKPNGKLIVDIGGGTCDVAVLSLNGAVSSKSIKVAGNHFDDAIIKFLARRYKVLVGERTAEQLKREIGCVYQPLADKTAMVKGRSLVTGFPVKFAVGQQELYEVLLEPAYEIVRAVKQVLEVSPPELVGDIIANGIVMTGGGCLLGGLDQLIEQQVGVKTVRAHNAMECVAVGTGKSFRFIDTLGEGFLTSMM